MFELLIIVLLIVFAPLAFGVLIGILGMLFDGVDARARATPPKTILPSRTTSGAGLVAWGLVAAAIVIVCVVIKYYQTH